MDLFEKILAGALAQAAEARGWQYRTGGCGLWARTGAAYLSFVLLDGLQENVRSLQCMAREESGCVLFDCRQYETLASMCMGDCANAHILLTDGNGATVPAVVSKELFMEMLDFLREG